MQWAACVHEGCPSPRTAPLEVVRGTPHRDDPGKEPGDGRASPRPVEDLPPSTTTDRRLAPRTAPCCGAPVSTPPDVLGRLLSRQDQVVSRSQLVQLGLDPHHAGRRVASGRWCRLLPSVFLSAPGPPSPRQSARAALLHGGPPSALTGRTACRSWRLRDVADGGPVDLLLPHELQRSGGPGLRVLRTRVPFDRSVVGGLTVVDPVRAVVDAARDGMSLRDVRALVLAAVSDEFVPLDRLLRAVDEGPRRHGALLRRAVHDAERGAVSAPEAEALDLLLPVAARLGVPLLVNPSLYVDGRLLGRPDLYLPTLALGLELDSRRHHAGVEDLDATLRRHRAFAHHGVRLLHSTPARLRGRPQELLAEVLHEVHRPWPVPSAVRVVVLRRG
ncbi:MAG: hypothetical protein JWN17_2796 [Frankiales bacterium]|nr:hypothetical protein [Frankiales bacterium]